MNYQNIFRVKLNRKQVIKSFIRDKRYVEPTYAELFVFPRRGEGERACVASGVAKKHANDNFDWPAGRNLAVSRAFAQFGRLMGIGLKPVDVLEFDEDGRPRIVGRDVVVYEKGKDPVLVSSDPEGFRDRFVGFAKSVGLMA